MSREMIVNTSDLHELLDALDNEDMPNEDLVNMLGACEGSLRAVVEAVNNHEKLLARAEKLEAAATRALTTLTKWCDRITEGRTGWDDWDEYYKDANYERKGRPSVIDDLKAALKEQP
jgi:hypothetical protein